MKSTFLIAAVLLAAQLNAQPVKVQKEVPDTLIFNHAVQAPAMPAPGRQIMHLRADVVKGAPYAAEAVTESIQTLSDGNRIVNTNTVKMYRDAEGRTRSEATIQPVGPWVADSKTTIITIHDPVTGEHYTLNAAAKTASKALIRTRISEAPAIAAGPDGKQVKEIRKEVTVTAGSAAGSAVIGHTVDVQGAIASGPAVMVFQGESGERVFFRHDANVETTSLGKQVIEGVECEGTREVQTIPAGQIGNEREIKVVTERWYSPELKMEVVRKHSDPRFGETNYRVSGLIRADQPRDLFEVPSEYKLDEMNSAMPVKIQRLREQNRNSKEPEIF